MTKAHTPPVRFLLHHPAHLIACGFGSGLSPMAPGTAGTLFAWLSFPWLYHWLGSDGAFSLFLLAGFVIGVWACQIAGRSLGVVDHGSIVWDEIVPFWAVLLFTPAGWVWQVAAFAWFRFYDIVKPYPASYFDEKVKSGFGVMMDDVVAAAYTVMTLAVFKAVLDPFLE
jgi:phosphatidylglycerophosphatase A